MEERGGWETLITADLAGFIAAQRSFFIATANSKATLHPASRRAAGIPACARRSHAGIRGLRGNRQYISLGNLAKIRARNCS